jgi:uncharacterized protein
MASFLSPLLRERRPFELRNGRSGAVLATRLVGAFDSTSRRKGLLGRDSMPAGEGLVIAPCNGVHTFFMRFAIDIVFVSKAGLVVKVRRAVPPWRLTAALRAYAVIELPAGTLGQADTHRGDSLVLA